MFIQVNDPALNPHSTFVHGKGEVSRVCASQGVGTRSRGDDVEKGSRWGMKSKKERDDAEESTIPVPGSCQ